MQSDFNRLRVRAGGAAALAIALSVGVSAPFAARAIAAASERSEPTTAGAVRYGMLSAKAARTMAEREISQAQLRDYLTFIASDELEGRDTPSKGLDIAARYIASHLSRWGLKPAGGDGSYFQKMTLVRRGFDPAKSTAALGDKPLRFGEDFLFTGSGAAPGEGGLVFVGHGWVVKSKNIDAYQGADVKGKFLVVVSAGFGPPGVRMNELNRDGEGTDWLSPEQYAAKNGALGVLRLPAMADDEAFRRSLRFLGRGSFAPEGIAPRPGRGGSGGGGTLPVIQVSPAVARGLLDGEKLSLDDAQKAARAADAPAVTAFALADAKRLKVSPAYVEEKATTQNVVAVLEGSDPKLRDEYVALGAHYDHVGVSTRGSAGGDVIFNGADDDGSGTVALMAVAEALARNPKERPRRSVLFVWHCGEEKGLWGSEHFTKNPTVPLEKIVTQINIDMIGRSRKPNDADPRNANLSEPHQIYVIGAKKLSTQLGTLAEKVNKGFRNIAYDYRYDDPNDPNRFYYRSDHYNYAKNGVPIIFFFDGVHEDYHQVGDEVDKIDFDKLEKVTQTVLLTTVEVANLPQRPVVDGKN